MAVAPVACGRLSFDSQDKLDAAGARIDAMLFGDGVAAQACGPTILIDDGFDIPGPGPSFSATNDSTLPITETGSQMVITFAATVAQGRYGYYRSVATFPVEGLCTSVEVVATPSASGGASYMKWNVGTQEVEFFEHDQLLDLRTHAGNTIAGVKTLNFDLQTQRYWRLRQQGGVTFWDTSADGVAYETQAATAFLTGTTGNLEFGAGALSAVSNGGTAAYDRALVLGP